MKNQELVMRDVKAGYSGESKIDVTFVGRMKHGTLYHAIRKRQWSVAQAADFLGLNVGTLYNVLGLQMLPPYIFSKHRDLRPETAEKARRLEEKLIELTGKTAEELFPPELRDKVFLAKSKLIIVDGEVLPSQLIQMAESHFVSQLEVPQTPLEAIDEEEKWQAVNKFIKEHFDERSVMMFHLYYIAGENTREIGNKFGVSRSAANFIINRIIRKLKTCPEFALEGSLNSKGSEELSVMEWAKRNRRKIADLAQDRTVR